MLFSTHTLAQCVNKHSNLISTHHCMHDCSTYLKNSSSVWFVLQWLYGSHDSVSITRTKVLDQKMCLFHVARQLKCPYLNPQEVHVIGWCGKRGYHACPHSEHHACPYSEHHACPHACPHSEHHACPHSEHHACLHSEHHACTLKNHVFGVVREDTMSTPKPRCNYNVHSQHTQLGHA